MKAYVKQKTLPYRGEPTRRKRIDFKPLSFFDLKDQKMGKPDRVVGRKKGEK